MPIQFSRIGLMAKYTDEAIQSTFLNVLALLRTHQVSIVLEDASQSYLKNDPSYSFFPKEELAKHCDLLITIGGDGSLLRAARLAIEANTPVVGINRGRRGFLTDIAPVDLKISLLPLLQGDYQEETRFLLDLNIIRHGNVIYQASALNEVALYSGNIARMIEFEVKIDGQFVYRQRSDGLITATPTGSTAYALAGGGPIVHPQLSALILVPMHPAVLSSRPIVLSSDSVVELHLVKDNPDLRPRVSCDGQIHFDVQSFDRLVIQRHPSELRLLHPIDYDYYHTLRTKLGWSA